MTRAAPLLLAIGVVAAVLGTYAALGGASFAPTPAADPCETREWRDPGGIEPALEQIVLSGLDGAACNLGVAREELVLALRSDDAFDAFVRRHGLDRAHAEQAIRNAALRAVDDAEEAGALPAFTASVVRRAVGALPPRLLLEALERLGSLLQ